ncbi:heparinase II/III domain-containing protein [Halomonas sp. RA08-2]|uniref:heparinase II/III domain-containing protein n=1 Tax=Halomonas sp. RA08-2 TaxID=3440842 RepID=UPI003EE97DB0
MFQYEDLSNLNVSKSISEAERILAEGWQRRNYPCVDLDEPIPWQLSDPGLRSWNFYIHCWDMLDPFLKAYSHSGERRFLKAAIEVAEDWVSRYPAPEAEQARESFAWYDMSVGLRAYRLAYIFQAGRQAEMLGVECQARLWQSLMVHHLYLFDDANIKFHNNHGYYQVAGQMAMGRRFAGESDAMAAAVIQSRERLGRMLQQQFTVEGMHREHSPDYHRMVYDTLKALIDAGLIEDGETIVFAEKVERALAWFVLPNQHIANFGDSDYRLMRRKPADAERKWRTPEMQYHVTSGKLGHAHERNWAIFPKSGYFIARHPDSRQPAGLPQSSYLAQTCAFHSRTHKHADDLSFIWSEYGSDILVDSGRYGYLGKTEQGSDLWLDGHWYSDPKRIYCESTRAHNTLEFDGFNYSRKGVKPYGSALKRWQELDDGLLVVESECKHFKSIRRVRLLFFMPGEWLLVLDWFNDNHKAPHQVKQWFHLAPELELLVEAGGYQIAVPGSDVPLRIASLLTGPSASRPIIGQDAPEMQGWWSPMEREMIPNYSFFYELPEVGNGVFATLFSFTRELEVPVDLSRTNVSGRKGRFCWVDDVGCHEIDFVRPQDGELNVAHVVR